MLSLEVREKLLGDRSALDPVGLVSALPVGQADAVNQSFLKKVPILLATIFRFEIPGTVRQPLIFRMDWSPGTPLMVMLPICRVMETMAP